MEKLVIKGGRKLCGQIAVHGSKNSSLPILAGAVLCHGETVIHNCPDLTDVDAAINILESLGCRIHREKSTLIIDSSDISSSEISEELMREMRSSIVFLGPLLARTGAAFLTAPGGCEIGLRPIDLHLKALRELGMEINEQSGRLCCRVKEKIKGAEITLGFPSVGATENIMLAAVTAEGTTVIVNAAREPEIKNLADFLNSCGGKIHFADKGAIIIEGVEKLHSTEFTVISDRIVAATYMAAVAISGGEADITNFPVDDIAPVLPAFYSAGCKIKAYSNTLHIKAPERLDSLGTLRTMPFPGFPTDFQAPSMAMAVVSEGTSIFIETIFESRYKHVSQLKRMGANISVEGSVAVVQGVNKLSGAVVQAEDLRGGAALVLAALMADGESQMFNLKHIDRGYEKIEDNLRLLGADIYREV